MSPGFLNNKSQNNASITSLSSIDCTYPLILANAASNWFTSCPYDTREKKRLKRNASLDSRFDESLSSTEISCITRSNSISSFNSFNSCNSLPRLQFRDHIWNYIQRYLAAHGIEEAASSLIESEEAGDEDRSADGMRLVQLLIACAEAVACRDKSHASALLSELRANALVFGSAFQRVASCFVEGLTDRLAMVHPIGGSIGTGSVNNPTMNIMDDDCEKKEEALELVYEFCPYIQFGHFIANMAILEAFEGESNVHVLDLGMTLGLPRGEQWRNLIESLANRPGKPPKRVRITAVGLSVKKFRKIGDSLISHADDHGINLEFFIVENNLENLKPEDINVSDNEVLVVNSILQLHCVVKESRGALNSVLQIIHELSPKILVLVEQDSSHNGPFFLGRFMEALHYYSAIFDSLDALFPKYDTKRAKMEQFYFAEEIKNIVSYEGPMRVERHERVDQWRRRMSRAGFQASPIKMLSQAQKWLKSNTFCEGYTVVEEKGCLVLGWKSKPIIAASCWKC